MTGRDAAVVAVTGVGVLAIVVTFYVNGLYTLQLAVACRELVDRRRRLRLATTSWLHRTPGFPSVTLILPAYQEEMVIVDAVTGALTLDYPELEVVVVNDGSSDDTLSRLVEAFDLVLDPVEVVQQAVHEPILAVYRSRTVRNLVVVDKAHGGSKADALNAGVTVASKTLVAALDADTLLLPDALIGVGRGWIEEPGTIAIGGTIRPLNGSAVGYGRVLERGMSTQSLAAVQTVEYLRAFYIGRLGWNRLGSNVIIAGAWGVFDRSALIAVGGYDPDAIAEDFDLIVRLRRRAYDQGSPGRVGFLPDPVAYTQVPATWAALRSQRVRWHRGLIEVLRANHDMILRPRYGAMGFGPMAYLAGGELVGPILEAFGYLALVLGLVLGIVPVWVALLFFVVVYLWTLLLGVGTLVLDTLLPDGRLPLRARATQLAALVLEPVTFRVLLVWWRLVATFEHVRGISATWRADRDQALAA